MALDVTLRGQIPEARPEDTQGVAVYLVQGKTVLAEVPLGADGQFALGLDRQALGKDHAPLEIVVAPAGLAGRLDAVPHVARVPLDAGQLQKAGQEYHLPLPAVKLGPDLRKLWGLSCRMYTVSGTVTGPNGCPAPFAGVTVYNVTHVGGSLYSKIMQADVVTQADGTFTASFPWCTNPYRICWPCWPWWRCWPWWWEWDILHVLEQIEPRKPIVKPFPPIGPGVAPGPLPLPPLGAQAPLTLSLKQPPGKELLRGQAFAHLRKEARLAPDPARTALITRKLADPRIRAIFPWWWWCCDDPNIVFTVRQGAGPVTIVLEEQPATDTRWCFEDGQHVTLVGNAQTLTVCPGPHPPPSGFAWARVGQSVLMDHIVQGYATTWNGGDAGDAAFAGGLDIYGEFGPDPAAVGYYQVHAGQWAGNPARGGAAPAASVPLTVDLSNVAMVMDGMGNVTFPTVRMGPIDLPGGPSNVYITQQHRKDVNVPGAPDFLGGGTLTLLGWVYSGRKVDAGAAALIAGGSLGAVRLTVSAFDPAGAPLAVPATSADTLDLMIDTTPLTTAHINSLLAYNSASETTPLALDPNLDCPAYQVTSTGHVKLNVTVDDANGHLSSYRIETHYGHGHQGHTTPDHRGYGQPVPGTFPTVAYTPPDVAHKSFVGGTDDIRFPDPAHLAELVNCCYDFILYAAKRVTDGTYGPGESAYDFQTAGLHL